MPYLHVQIHPKRVCQRARVYEVIDGVERLLGRVIAVNTMEGWVEELPDRPGSKTNVVMHRRGTFIVRDGYTGRVWPD